MLSFVANARDLCSISLVLDAPLTTGGDTKRMAKLKKTGKPSVGGGEPGRRPVEAAWPPIVGRPPRHQVGWLFLFRTPHDMTVDVSKHNMKQGRRRMEGRLHAVAARRRLTVQARSNMWQKVVRQSTNRHSRLPHTHVCRRVHRQGRRDRAPSLPPAMGADSQYDYSAKVIMLGEW
jgi:hypothetical protein